MWKVAALRSFLDQNFPWIKISHKVFKKSTWSILKSIVIVRLFTSLFGIYCEVNYNLENWISCKMSKVKDAGKIFKFRLSTLLQMASTKYFYIKMPSDFLWNLYVSSLPLALYFQRSLTLLTTFFVLVLNYQSKELFLDAYPTH